MDNIKFAIFKMTANGQGGYDLLGMADDFCPSENKKEAVEFCEQMNKLKPDSWHYFTVFEINKDNQAISPSSGEIIYR